MRASLLHEIFHGIVPSNVALDFFAAFRQGKSSTLSDCACFHLLFCWSEKSHWGAYCATALSLWSACELWGSVRCKSAVAFASHLGAVAWHNLPFCHLTPPRIFVICHSMCSSMRWTLGVTVHCRSLLPFTATLTYILSVEQSISVGLIVLANKNSPSHKTNTSRNCMHKALMLASNSMQFGLFPALKIVANVSNI